jgi:hypothetical protein
MVFIRVVNPDYHFDHNTGRFKDLAFRPQRGADGINGVSCFERACADQKSGSVCKHIGAFYRQIASAPAVFWAFEQSDIPEAGSIVQKTENGDECHHNISGISGEKLRKIPKSWKIEDMTICNTGGDRPLTPADLETFKAAVEAANAANIRTTPG